MANLDFYKHLPAFTDPAELMRNDHYQDVPADWIIFATDVRGSTKAIEAGLYKQVNTIGAASIIAAKNACPGEEFPFVFGGDGATMVVPPELSDKICRALAFLREKSTSAFELELRVARLPIRDVAQMGGRVRVAKLQLSPQNAIAMFAGGGLSLAESMMKSPHSGCEVPRETVAQGSMEGLECRWNPVPSTRGGMLTLIVEADPQAGDLGRAAVYDEILETMQDVIAKGNPVKPANLSIQWPPRTYLDEVRMKYPPGWKRLGVMVKLFFWTLVQAIWVRKNRDHPPNNEAGRYLAQFEKNTDSIKVDDNLRMVLDVTLAEKAQVEALFEKLRRSRGIRYGMNFSPEALMTCFVRSATEHVHFIDGGDGGYAVAAKQLKAQKR